MASNCIVNKTEIDSYLIEMDGKLFWILWQHLRGKRLLRVLEALLISLGTSALMTQLASFSGESGLPPSPPLSLPR